MESLMDDCTPPEMRTIAAAAAGDILPDKSRERYEQSYEDFLSWGAANNVKDGYVSERVILAWLKAHDHLAPTTLWTRYSMIKKVHNSRFPQNRLGDFQSVTDVLKKKEKTHLRKKSNTFTREHIAAFIEKCGSSIEFSVMILISLFMIFGALRKKEAAAMTVDQVKAYEDHLIVTIPDSKTGPRSFAIPNQFNILERFKGYMEKRACSKSSRLWLCWQKTRYAQPIGNHKIAEYPSRIATLLGLESPEKWTSHAYRRTAATWAADAGIDMINLKWLGGWKSDTVAAQYIAESPANKRKIGAIIAGSPEPVQKKSHQSDVHVVDQNGPSFLAITHCTNVSFSNCTFIVSSTPTPAAPKQAPAE